MALEGNLRDMSLSDLLHVFQMGQKTGVLFLTYPGLRAIVSVAAGVLVDAAIIRLSDRSVIAINDEAIIQMLLWDDATFVFRHNSTVTQRPVRVRHSAEHLILESLKRRQSPQTALPYHHVTPDTCLQLSPLAPGRENSVSLSVDQWRILSQVPHCLSIRAISTATGLSLDQTIRLVLELMAIGLIEIVPTRRQTTSFPPHREMFATETDERSALPMMTQPGNRASPTQEHRTPIRRSLIDAVMRRVRAL